MAFFLYRNLVKILNPAPQEPADAAIVWQDNTVNLADAILNLQDQVDSGVGFRLLWY